MIDINNTLLQLERMLDSIFQIEKNMYDMYLSDTPQQVNISYTDLNNNVITVTIDNIAKIKQDIINNATVLQNKTTVNVLKNFSFSDGINHWSLNTLLTYSHAVTDLTVDDMAEISVAAGENIFSGLNGAYKKLVIDIPAPGNKEDFKLQQTAATLGYSVWHEKSFLRSAFIKINTTPWTNDLTYVLPVSYNEPFELQIGHISHFEIFYPALIPTYNHGLVVSC